MFKSRSAFGLMMSSLSLAMLAGCSQPAPVGPNPVPSGQPSQGPSANPSGNPSGGPSANPSSDPSGNPSANPSGEPSGNPSPTPTPTALPSDVSVLEPTTLNGMIYDDTQAPLSGATVRVRSLSSLSNFDATATSAGGSYVLNGVPAGIQLEITATLPGYTTRKRVEVLKSNKNGDPNANRYDFGTNGSASSFGTAQNALSDKPEVVQVTPERNASGIAPASNLVLRFSEPMDRNTVLDNLEIKAYTGEKLSVDSSGSPLTVTGSGALTSLAGTRIWDKSAFNASWNSDDTELTLSFRDGRSLPSDKESSKVPEYQVALERQDGQLKDKAGVTRNNNYFKLTDGAFERSYKFSIQSDQAKPQLDSMIARTAENGGINGDSLQLRFSERMIHYTLGPTIAGGMGGAANAAPAAVGATTAEQAAGNYTVEVIRSGNPVLGPVKWSQLGGRAVFDTNDANHQSVLLQPAMNSAGSQSGLWLNAQSANMTGDFSTNASDDAAPSDDQAVLRLVQPDGSASTLAINLAENLADTAAVGSDLQTRLNTAANAAAPAPSSNPFTVTTGVGVDGIAGTADDTLRIRFQDNSGNYLGWNIQSNFTGSGPILMAGAVNYGLNQLLNVYQPGDEVRITVSNSVLDPAGNSIDSSNDEVTANAS
ncbi:MAG: carboxypeptidase regulatory-like domain-containing protein [Candidatus Sericytochromatia bacterium]